MPDADALGPDFTQAPRPLVNRASRPGSAASARSELLLCRNTRNLIGREQQVSAVLESLRQHGAAVIWGSPGEGKTSVAAEAGCRLQEDVSAAIKLSVVIDLNGVRACVLRDI